MNHDSPHQFQSIEPGVPEEEFEKLRQRFHERLRREQTQLATLAKALGSGNGNSALIFADIEAFAHRLRGAALVFGYGEIGNVAKDLELAAVAAALDENGARNDPSVVSGMQGLSMRLAAQSGSSAVREPAMTAATCPSNKVSQR
jgi:HPt (histidine-containing phosphotransfer) domain-containing protein